MTTAQTREYDEMNPYKLSKEPLLQFKLEFKSPRWIIWINSRYDAIDKWTAVTELETNTVDDEYGNKITVAKIKLFNNQIEAYAYIASNFEQGTIVEYVLPKLNWWSRLLRWNNGTLHPHV